MYDLQKADVWKRISALLFDLILLVIAVIGAAVVLSMVLGYDEQAAQLESVQAKFEAEYGVSFAISKEEYNAMTDAEKEQFDSAYSAFSTDKEAVRLYGMMVNLSLLIVTFAILIGYLLLEFLVPLFLKNGQTLGKKIFGIGVMREDGVRLSPLLLFIRTILGKYTIETMIPVMIIFMLLFQTIGIVGIIVLVLFAILQIVTICITKARTPLHDLLAHTVTVDFASQRIFDSPEELLAYKQKLHAEQVKTAEY